MKNLALPWILALLVCSSLAGALAATFVAGRSPEPREPVQAASPAEADTARAVREIAAEQVRLFSAIEDLRARVAMNEQASSRVPQADRSVSTAPSAAGLPPADELASASPEKLDLERTMADLLDPALPEQERQELWQKAREAGLLDQIVAEFERRAELDPNNPDRQVEQGEAYLQKIFEVGNGPMAGVWATKADGSFDRALELDPEHWEARFTKAVSLSFWPPIFAKQGEAIHQFEVLIGQQEQQGTKSQFAQTYLLLGNMYQQVGKKEQALALWQKGAGLFPDNDALKKQLETYGAH